MNTPAPTKPQALGAHARIGEPILSGGRLSFDVERDGFLQTVWFELPRDWEYAPDLIAAAASTLLGEKFKRIHFDFGLSIEAIEQLQSVWKASITAKSVVTKSTREVRGAFLGLNFSGGFDSLASKALAPRGFRLISLDFGAGFEREVRFFSEFPTTVVKTNLRQLGLDKNSWTFMGVGAILLRDYLRLSHIGFGSILEASSSNLISVLARPNTANPPLRKRFARRAGAPTLASNVFAAAGMHYLNPVSGMTEVGTTKIVAEQFPELAERSLESLAPEGSEKLDRKRLLLSFYGGGGLRQSI